MELHLAPAEYSRILHYDAVKEIQFRLTVSTFRGIEYLSIRKYYLDFEEQWRPTPEGVSFPISIENSKELFIGLTEILSKTESKEILEEFMDVIQPILGKDIEK